MKGIIALSALCLILQAAAEDQCLATADLANKCDPTPTSKCTTGTADCPSFSTEATCEEKSCAWKSEACTDGCSSKTAAECAGASPCVVKTSCKACSDQTIESECTAVAGCAWSSNACADKACSALDQALCTAAADCMWDASACKDKVCPGTGTAVETTCDNEKYCEWSSSTCGPTADYCGQNGINQADCDAHKDCIWDGTGCGTLVAHCSDLWDDQDNTACTNVDACKLDDTANPSACVRKVCADGADSDGDCTAISGCTWDTDTCRATVCADGVATQAACEAIADCSYVGSTCVTTDCLKIHKDACDADAKCDWASPSSCTVKEDVCVDTLEAACMTETRCDWEFSCDQPANSGCTSKEKSACDTANECDWTSTPACHMSDEDCSSHTAQTNCCTNSCAWVDCKGAGAGAVEVAISTLVLSVMGVKILI